VTIGARRGHRQSGLQHGPRVRRRQIIRNTPRRIGFIRAGLVLGVAIAAQLQRIQLVLRRLSIRRFQDVVPAVTRCARRRQINAEIAGTFEGTLNVRQKLWIRATGKVSGTVRYGRIEIEEGGQIAGEIQVDTSSLGKPEGNDGG
jgi:hypothetical protein